MKHSQSVYGIPRPCHARNYGLFGVLITTGITRIIAIGNPHVCFRLGIGQRCGFGLSPDLPKTDYLAS